MKLKKHYAFAPADNARRLAGEKVQPMSVVGIEVKHAPKGVQRLSQRWLDDGIENGWLTFGKGKMSLAGINGDSVLDLHVVRTPGRYCCICEEKLPYDQFARDDKGRTPTDPGFDPKTAKTDSQRYHMDVKHSNVLSPDPQNPAGYRWETFYSVVNPGSVTMTREDAVELEKKDRHALHNRIHKAMADAKKSLVSKILTNEKGVVANAVITAALGRAAELYKNVQTDAIAASTLGVAILFLTGIEADSVLKDKATFDQMVVGATNEATNVNYARKVLTQAELAAWDPDEVNNWTLLDFPDQTWTAVGAAAGAWAAAVINYDVSSTQVTATLMECLTIHDFAVTPDGSDIILQTPNGFFKAS